MRTCDSSVLPGSAVVRPKASYAVPAPVSRSALS